MPHPPAFGRPLLPLWPLDPAITYLNHGTVGATPRAVLAAQAALRDEIERQPARFLLRELTPIGRPDEHPDRALPGGPHHRMRAAAALVAVRLGTDGDALVFVDNATAGANAVLASFPLAAGDEVLVTNRSYGAVARAAAHHAARAGARIVTAQLPFPVSDAASLLDALERALTPRTRLAVLDHVSPETSLVMPLAEMAALCRARGVAVLADGAHAPGALPVDIPSLGVDYYTANLHKWAFAPRSAGILWAAPERRAGLHPPVISWGAGGGWIAEFDWVGTRDPTPFLCAPDGFAFLDEALGGADTLWSRNHALAWRSAERLTTRWGLPWTTPREMVASMVTLPLPPALGRGFDAAMALKTWLLARAQIEAQILAIDDKLVWRFSAQAYNDDEDVERFTQALADYAAAG
ncbi:MAG TPA: aminotransferase class V-fold PLP-dependent enzyme [Ideonella sp.]|nr:aminotransferase class V-fold PLP-dependent enzyme [Ideonella sp.]